MIFHETQLCSSMPLRSLVAVSIMPVLVWDLLTSMRKEFLWFILCPIVGVDQAMKHSLRSRLLREKLFLQNSVSYTHLTLPTNREV